MSLDSAQDVLQAKDRKLAHLATQLATQGAMLASADQQIKGGWVGRSPPAAARSVLLLSPPVAVGGGVASMCVCASVCLF